MNGLVTAWRFSALALTLRAAARQHRQRPRLRRRTRTLWCSLVLTLMFLAPGVAHAADGTAPQNPFFAAFDVTDSRGNNIGAYELSLGGDAWNQVTGQVFKALAIMVWDLYRFLVAVVMWIFDFSTQFKLLDLLAPVMTQVTSVLQHTIIQLAIIGLLTVICFIYAALAIMNGRLAAGLAELCIGLFLASLAINVNANPVGAVAGPDGLLVNSRDLGIAVSHNITSGKSSASTDPATMKRDTTGVMVDAFIRLPHQLANYGAVIDGTKCEQVYEEAIKAGPYGDKPTAREKVGGCDPAYKASAENPQSALTTVNGCGIGGVVLAIVGAIFGVGITYLLITALIQAAKFVIDVVKGILPNQSRADVAIAVGIIFHCCLTIVGLLIGVGVYVAILRALFINNKDWNPVLTFYVIDLVLVVVAVTLTRALLRAHKSGHKLGQALAKHASPAAKSISPTQRPSPLSTTARMVGQQVMQRRTLQSTLGRAGLNSSAAPPTTSSQTSSPERAMTLGRVTGMAAKGTLTAAKIGLASTLGAPVYAPRAYGAAKVAMTARKAELLTKIDTAKANARHKVDTKTGQVNAFGKEYAHNLGAAARFAGRASGASNVAHAAIGLGAGPVAAGVLAGATYLANRGPSRTRPGTIQRPPSQTRPTPSNRAAGAGRPGPSSVPQVDSVKLADLQAIHARRSGRPAGPVPRRVS